MRTTVVGSYPIPKWLVGSQDDPQTLFDAITVVLQAQERAGIEVVTDGELSRVDPGHPETNGMIEYFIRRMDGIDTSVSRVETERFRSNPDFRFRTRPAGVVRDRIGEGFLNLSEDWRGVSDLAAHPLKFTVTCPYMLGRTLLDDHYGNLDDLVMDLAEVLRLQLSGIKADVIQLDEANLTGNPSDWPLASRAINHVLSGVDDSRIEKGIHLCFGNYGGQTVQKGFWRDLLPFFNSLDCDHLVLEFARRGYEELEAFRDLEARIGLGLGVIDIKDNVVETSELVAGRIEKAVNVLGENRVQWVHPDCGFWMLPRSVADAKMRTLVAGRDLFLGV
jgi:5-methyltetrahydropteroyltriglutamate--homocysteine methyltransferase